LHKYLYTHADPVNGIDPTGYFASMCSSLGGLAIATAGLGIGAFVIMGAHNASMGQGKFLPDGLLAGGNITLSMKTLDYLAPKIVDGLISVAPYFQSLGMPLNSIAMQAGSAISGTQFPALNSSTSNFFDNHFSVSFGVDYVYSSGDNKKAFFLYMTIQISSQQTSAISGSVYTGAVWNMPELGNYRGGTLGFGVDFGMGYITIGFNYFASISPNDKGLYPRGYTIGWNFGPPSKKPKLELSGTVTLSWGPYFEN
jgi:hypothetical protein